MKIELDDQGHTADGKWRLVPVECTHDMIDAAMNNTESFAFYAEYSEAIKAAPVYVPPAPTTRYDWSKIPEGYDWAATDRYGNVACSKTQFVMKPTNDFWLHHKGHAIEVSKGDPCPDWRESLEKRP